MNRRSLALSLRVIASLTALLFSGCLAAFPDNDPLPVQQACLITTEGAIPVTLEMAKSPQQRSRGLMEREYLAPDAGMLFVYRDQRRADHGFWMYRTLIPLDIAYLDHDGIIRAIRQMPPCPQAQGRDCPTYPAGVPFYRALEMNHGFFESRGIEEGDRLSLEPSDCR
ncbi:DUF192 domain-containing protein [Marinobacter orientalis]|uniref:DUF192 domain-containing protein n=1 Tax=Marinobacter orientalis TaxID=1928859 RepID=A0A7Y0RCC9_9GAMM|nr:DUF192 domain-containing protein [Marinobacter orientalis]NMT63637.1 DUF192 domain-containing protein [Marinobacter orientalis]TGX49753.1 DUF192 domain-containing protein [Marinobacter orientalis]